MKILNMNVAEESILSAKETSAIIGGRSCTCSCYYRYVGGSSIEDNRNANYAGGENGLESVHHTADEQNMADHPDGGTYVWGEG